MNLLKALFFFMLLSLLSSCLDFQMIKFNGMDKLKMVSLNDKEIRLNVAMKVDNPNKFNIKIKPSNLKVFVDEKFLGTIFLDEKIKFKKKAEGIYETDINIKLEQGAFFKMMKYAVSKEVPVRLEGIIKSSVYGIPKRIKINQSQVIDGTQLRNNALFPQ
jgi:LEA14-like dessication related protein